MEDSTGCMHGSRGVVEPASPEAQVRAGHRGAASPRRRSREADGHRLGCAGSATTHSIRDEIEAIYPDIFHDFNARMWTPGGFRRPMPAAPSEMEDPERQGEFHRAAGLR